MALLNINILSFNVNGLGNGAKRNEFFIFLSSVQKIHSFDIICLQETHMDCKLYDILPAKWKSSSAIWSVNETSKGVAVLFNSERVSLLKKLPVAQEDREIRVEISIDNIAYLLINSYVPATAADRTRE